MTLAGSTTATNREEFEGALRPILDLAFRYSFRLTNDREDAMDLVQDASVAAYKAYYQFVPGSNFRAWYLRILTNCF